MLENYPSSVFFVCFTYLKKLNSHVFVYNLAFNSSPFFLVQAHFLSLYIYTSISIKVVHEQSRKVEYERERLLGIANTN
jgi:hypothetical protein